MYDRYIGSEIRQFRDILAAAGKGYIQHACGHVKHLVERMKDCGVKAVESLSSPPTGNVSLRQARAMAGTDLAIIGAIEPTHFLSLAPKDLAAYVEQALQDSGGGPFVLANADSCPPGVTMEKFRLAADVAKRWRAR